jgi:choline kinase
MSQQAHDVLVIAAGSSRRLASRTRRRPKALLQVGGRTLIERSLDALDQHGLRHVTIVVGYLRERFHRELGPRYKGLSIHYVDSPGWRSAGQALSFLLALEHWQTRGHPALFLHADILYHPRILSDVLASPHPDLIAVDERFREETQDEVLACGAPDRIARIQKIQEQPSAVLGEVISLNKWSAPLLRELLPFAREFVASKGTHADWETIVDAYLQQARREIRPLLCGHLPWVNVNYEADLLRADALALQLDAELGAPELS